MSLDSILRNPAYPFNPWGNVACEPKPEPDPKKLQEEIERLKKEVKEHRDQGSLYCWKYYKCEKARGVFKTENDQLKAKLAEAYRQHALAAGEIAGLKSALGNSQDEVIALSARTNDAISKQNESQCELSKARRERNDAQRQLESSKKANEILKQADVQTRGLLAEARKERDAANAALKAIDPGFYVYDFRTDQKRQYVSLESRDNVKAERDQALRQRDAALNGEKSAQAAIDDLKKRLAKAQTERDIAMLPNKSQVQHIGAAVCEPLGHTCIGVNIFDSGGELHYFHRPRPVKLLY